MIKKKKSRSYKFWSKDNFFLSSLLSFFPAGKGDDLNTGMDEVL